jgi:hypothetical protein
MGPLRVPDPNPFMIGRTEDVMKQTLGELIESFLSPSARSKRRSRHSNEIFATRKDCRIFNRQFLKPREHVRINPNARRAKAVRD